MQKKNYIRPTAQGISLTLEAHILDGSGSTQTFQLNKSENNKVSSSSDAWSQKKTDIWSNWEE